MFNMLFLILIVDIVVANPLNETVDVDSSNNETLSKTNNETLSKAYLNDWDGRFRWACPYNRPISRIQSEHSSWYGDRRFDYRCEAHPLLSVSSTTCRWTDGWINDYEESINYSCSGAGYVSGFESKHSNWYEDRKWKVKCCSGSGTCLTECRTSGYVNGWEADMDYSVPDGKVITSVRTSEHSYWYEDRRWKFRSCKLVRC